MSLYPQKRSRPHGLPNTPFDPRVGTFLPLGDVGVFREFTIVEVGHDVLLCKDRENRYELILKPWAFRRSSFNGLTIDGVLYESTGLDVRDATSGTDDPVEERVEKPYFVGERIMAYKRDDRDGVKAPVGSGELTSVGAGSYQIQWEDSNTAGRGWDGGAGSSASTRYVAMVVSPSSEGKQSSYKVNIYGANVSSLSVSPTQVGVEATQPVVNQYFYRGEVVTVRLIAGEWTIGKFFNTYAGVVAAGELWVRPFMADNATVPDQAATSRLAAMTLQDALFDYSEIAAVIDDTATVLEALGNYNGTHVVSALFDPTNIVPVKPESGLVASVCSLISSANNSGTNPTFGTWTSAFVGSFTSNQPYAPGTPPALTQNAQTYVNVFTRSTASLGSASHTVQILCDQGPNLTSGGAAFEAARVPRKKTTDSLAKADAAGVFVEVAYSPGAPSPGNTHIINGFRMVTPPLVWKGTLTTTRVLTPGGAMANDVVNPIVLS